MPPTPTGSASRSPRSSRRIASASGSVPTVSMITWTTNDALRAPALVTADRLAGVPRCGPRRRGRGLGLPLDMGSPARDLRAVGAASLRGLGAAVGAGAADVADAPRPDGRCQHVPQPGPHREAGDDP